MTSSSEGTLNYALKEILQSINIVKSSFIWDHVIKVSIKSSSSFFILNISSLTCFANIFIISDEIHFGMWLCRYHVNVRDHATNVTEMTETKNGMLECLNSLIITISPIKVTIYQKLQKHVALRMQHQPSIHCPYSITTDHHHCINTCP